LRLGKRMVDMALGTALALVALPLIVVMAIGVAATLRAWPFFSQVRVGRRGRLFTFIKLRTLPPAVHPYTLKPAIREVRIPWFTRFLRDRHLDELPQLFLVVTGRMSLVGPRPKMPDEFEPVDSAYAEVRTTVRPGCTCLWQIGEHTSGLPNESPDYDMVYLDRASLRMDLWILGRTAWKMLGVDRPVHLARIPAWTLGDGFHAGGAEVASSLSVAAGGGS